MKDKILKIVSTAVMCLCLACSICLPCPVLARCTLLFRLMPTVITIIIAAAAARSKTMLFLISNLLFISRVCSVWFLVCSLLSVPSVFLSVRFCLFPSDNCILSIILRLCTPNFTQRECDFTQQGMLYMSVMPGIGCSGCHGWG